MQDELRRQKRQTITHQSTMRREAPDDTGTDVGGWPMQPGHIAVAVASSYIVLGFFVTLLGDGSDAANRHSLFNTGLALYACAGILLMFARRNPAVVVNIGALTFNVVAVIGYQLLGMVGFLMLLPIPLLLMVANGLVRNALFMLVLQQLLLVGIAVRIGWPSIYLIGLGNLGALIISFTARRGYLDNVRWVHFHYEAARRELDQARNRLIDLNEVVDQLVHTNRQLDLLNERVAALRTKAEEAQRSKAAFVAKVSHEFRTPLNMIIGLIDLLTQHPQVYGQHLPTALAEDLHIVHRNCEYLSGMINDVLDLSQTDAGRLTLHREWGDLAADIHHALDVVRPLIDKKGLVLHVEGVEHGVMVLRDQTRIRQVMLNLLSNAARYTIHGSVTVRLKEQPTYALVEVSDTGPGIARDDLERVFEPFYQSGSMDGRSQLGSGLGLSITKQFVELHGGKLWVESMAGEGSTFFVMLPISPPSPLESHPAGWIHPEWHWIARQSRLTLPKLPRCRRLVLYDETDGFHPVLETDVENFEVVGTQQLDDIDRALEHAPAHAVIINATSLEKMMQMVEEVSQRAIHTPVIGWIVPCPTSRAQEAGALEYLVKPVTRADLAEAFQLVNRPVRRVLVVDDDEQIRRLMTRVIHAFDTAVEVMVAGDIMTALVQMQSGNPDVLLLDLTLADGSGWTLLEKKREDAVIRDIPTIIISAQDPAESPPSSSVIIGALGTGLSSDKLARASIMLADLMMVADSTLVPTPAGNHDGGSV